MKFIPLDGKKEPPFDIKMIVALDEDPFQWMMVMLEKIEITPYGKEYTFKWGDHEYTNATHYCIPELPKK